MHGGNESVLTMRVVQLPSHVSRRDETAEPDPHHDLSVGLGLGLCSRGRFGTSGSLIEDRVPTVALPIDSGCDPKVKLSSKLGAREVTTYKEPKN